MMHGFLNVKDFTPQWKNRLESTVAALFCRSTRRISLNEIDFALSRILLGTIGKFSWKSAAAHHGFTLNHLACFLRRVTCLSRENYLLYDGTRVIRIFFEVVLEHFAHRLAHRRYNFAVSKFGFRLTFELRFGNFHRNDSRQTFTEVITRNLEFQFIEHSRSIGVLFQRTRKPHAETLKVRSAFVGVDVVYV